MIQGWSYIRDLSPRMDESKVTKWLRLFFKIIFEKKKKPFSRFFSRLQFCSGMYVDCSLLKHVFYRYSVRNALID
jgi:hypothetical protein